MGKNEIYQFYVEGEDEKKVVNVLKKDLKCIVSGKVDVLNVVLQEIRQARLRTLKRQTNVVLIYDTDVENLSILERNIELLKKSNQVKRVICIPQVSNLEDELARATLVKEAKDILDCKSSSAYKRELLRCSNLDKKLVACEFQMDKFWTQTPKNSFGKFGNDSDFIRKK